MNFFDAFLKLLGMFRGKNRKAANDTRSLSQDPEPIHFSQAQREQIEKRIAEFIADASYVHADFFPVIKRLNVLPLYFDWTVVMALRSDGQIVLVPYEGEQGEVEVVRDELWRNTGLFKGAKLHPDLHFLVPTRPSDASDCPDCKGTGKLTFPPRHEHLTETVTCYCGGIGWLSRTALERKANP